MNWKPDKPVSPTCETWREGTREACGCPSKFAYPAMGGGYHAMCPGHAERHMAYCVTYQEACAGKKPKSDSQAGTP